MQTFQSKSATLKFHVQFNSTNTAIRFMELEVDGNNRHVMTTDEELNELVNFVTDIRDTLYGRR